jgi:predicted nucleotidyltransferase
MIGENRQAALERLGREHGLLAIYLFGSRADDGLRLLDGEAVARVGSDLDVGVVFLDSGFDLRALVKAQLQLEELFEPLRVDVVSLQRVDAIFQSHAVDGHRIFAADAQRTDLYELYVLARAGDLLHWERQRELELFGVSTT